MADINLRRNIMISGSFRILIMVVIFLTSWLSTRYLGVELKGKFSYLITLVGFIWIVLDLGIHKTYPYLIRKQPELTNTLFTWSYIVFFSELVILGSLAAIFYPLWSKLAAFPFTPFSLSMFFLLILLTQLFGHLQMFYLGLDRVKANSLGQFSNHAIFLIFIALAAIFLKDIDRLDFVLGAIVITLLIVIAGYSYRYFPRMSTNRVNSGFIRNGYGMGFKVFLSSLFITLLLRADIIILKKFGGFSSVGIYSLAAQIVDIIQIASNLVGSLLLVKLSDTSNEIERWSLMRKVFIAFFILIGIVNLGFVLIGKPFIIFVYGQPFSAVYGVYLWLIPASFGLSFGSLFNTYLWSKGFPLVSVLLPLIALIMNIALNFVLIPKMGIAGAALASSIAYCFWFLLNLVFEQRLSQNRMMKYLIPTGADFNELWAELRRLLPTRG